LGRGVPGSWGGRFLRTATNVPGRKIRPNTAIVFIDELSRLVALTISLEALAMDMLSLLSRWEIRLYSCLFFLFGVLVGVGFGGSVLTNHA
jgi:hypothetical protein